MTSTHRASSVALLLVCLGGAVEAAAPPVFRPVVALRREVVQLLGTGKSAEAQELTGRLRAIAETEFSADPSRLAECLNWCVVAHREKGGSHCDACAAAEALRTLWAAQGNAENEAEALLLLAELYFDADDEPQQFRYQIEAMDTLANAGIGKGPVVADAYSALAMTYFTLGNELTAAAFIEKAWNLIRPILARHPEVAARILLCRGAILRGRNPDAAKVKEATEQFSNAFDIYALLPTLWLPDFKRSFTVLFNLNDLRDIGSALTSRLGGAIAGAELLVTGVQVNAATPWLLALHCDELSKQSRLPESSQQVGAGHLTSWLTNLSDRLDPTLEAMIRVKLASYSRDSPATVAHLRRALRAAESPTVPVRLRVFIRKDLAEMLARDAKTKPEAFDQSRKALDELLVYLNSALPYMADQQRLRLLANTQDTLHLYISLALARGEANASIYRYVAAWKELTFTHAAAEAELQANRNVEELAPLERQYIVAAQAHFAAIKKERPREGRPLASKDYLETLLNKDLAALRLRFARFDVAKLPPPPRPLTAEQVCRALPPEAAFVDYFFCEHRTFEAKQGAPPRREPQLLAFVLSRAQPVVVVRLPRTSEALSRVVSWRERHDKGVRKQELAAESKAIGDLIWEPLVKTRGAEHLAKVRRVIVSPDAFAWHFPFVYLPGRKEGQQYLIEEVCFSYTLSARHLLRPSVPKLERPHSFLFVGEPRYSADFLKTQGPIPGNRGASRQVIATFRERFPLAKTKAVSAEMIAPKTLLHELRQYDYLCLEMHGPIASKPATTTREWYELFNQRLELSDGEQVSLECLSLIPPKRLAFVECWMCDVNRAMPSTGQGMLALPRTLSKLGSEAILFTMWKVTPLDFRDGAGRTNLEKLRDQFHHNLWEKGMDKSEALWAAQLETIRLEGNEDWAAFAILGNTEPLNSPSPRAATFPKPIYNRGGTPDHWLLFLVGSHPLFFLLCRWCYRIRRLR